MVKKRSTRALAVIMVLMMVLTVTPMTEHVLPGSDGPASYAAQAPEAEYEFDHSKSAVSQLEDLFTTIDIMEATVAGLSDEMEQGNVTSEQLVQMYIDRIRAYDRKKKINSIISINPNALSDARALDAERAAGKVRGPLHGIPVLVKDNYDLTGTASTAGSLALAGWTSNKDSFAVKKLKEAGAVVIAKANLSEFASSAFDSHSLIGGYTHNPYDITRSPAGSSGGTGAAIAANFAVIGYGTDTGGSIRNPSSWCNLYGIRPSKGLTSIDGVVPLYATNDTTGPMARTAEDMAIGLETIAGTDQNDDWTQEADADALLGDGYSRYLSEEGLKGKRIGYLKSSFSLDTVIETEEGEQEYKKYPDAKVTQMILRTRADLRKAGASFVDMSDLLNDDDINAVYEEIMNSSIDSTEYDTNKYLHDHGGNAPFDTLKALLSTGKYGIDYTNLYDNPKYVATLADTFEETKNPYDLEIDGYKRHQSWEKSLKVRKDLKAAMDEKNVDAIMFVQEVNVPIHDVENLVDSPQIRPSINDQASAYSFLYSANVGCPEMVIPMGFSETDADCPVPMPIGMHLFGRFGDERTLMQIAYAYEQQAGPDIRQAPSTTPALRDPNLNAFLVALMEESYNIDYSLFGTKPEGKAKILEKAFDKAAAVDKSDPYAVYKAAYELAKSYDKTVGALKKGATTFTVKVSKKKVKASDLKRKKAQVQVKVTNLSKGSSKPSFAVSKVTKGQKAKVKVNSTTGKVTIKKGTKKCTIYIKVTSKESKYRKAKTKTAKIQVK